MNAAEKLVDKEKDLAIDGSKGQEKVIQFVNDQIKYQNLKTNRDKSIYIAGFYAGVDFTQTQQEERRKAIANLSSEVVK